MGRAPPPATAVATGALALAALVISGAHPALTGRVLLYDGATRDILINYSLWAIQAAVVAWEYGHAAPSPSGGPGDDPGSRLVSGATTPPLPEGWPGWHLLQGTLFFVAYQVGLCVFVTECTGISIIWNAFTGLLVWEAFVTGAFPARLVGGLVVPLTAAADAFYLGLDALQGDYLTTLAHALAVLLGLLVGFILNRRGACTKDP